MFLSDAPELSDDKGEEPNSGVGAGLYGPGVATTCGSLTSLPGGSHSVPGGSAPVIVGTSSSSVSGGPSSGRAGSKRPSITEDFDNKKQKIESVGEEEVGDRLVCG